MSKMNAGQIPVELDGETRYLLPTPKAIRLISRHFGGINTALNQIGAMNFEAFVFVIGTGLGVKDSERKGLDDLVFDAGLVELTRPVCDYLSVLANGGRPVEEPVDEEGDDEGEADGV